MKRVKPIIIAALGSLLAAVFAYVGNSVLEYFRSSSMKSIALYVVLCVIVYFVYSLSRRERNEERDHWEDN